ncbi:hypothetical protein [Lentzea cavernae]|uniref:hypothetical protein n=1 Tax=Lentzea cavernae TaxID=2020703 RepID=UPI00174E0003|nr:hypothetical protein [Lentzea cavernae]
MFHTTNAAGNNPLRRAADKMRELADLLGVRDLTLRPDAYIEVFGRDSTVAHPQIEMGGDVFPVHVKTSKNRPFEGAARVNIVSGVCLFSDRRLRTLDVTGRDVRLLQPKTQPPMEKIVSLRVDDRMSLYEYESSLRQMALVRGLLASIPASTPVSVTLDLPRAQYYLFLVDALKCGMVGTDLALAWFDEVDLRRRRVAELMVDEISRPGLRTGRSCPIQLATAFDDLADHVRSVVSSDGVPEIEDCVAVLDTSGDDMWDLLRTTWTPRTFHDLGYAGYTIEKMRASLNVEGKPPELGLMVDSASEGRGHSAAESVQRDLARRHPGLSFAMAGLYSLEKLMVAGDSRPLRSLYFNDPGTVAVDTTGTEVDLIRATYELYHH